MSIVKTFSVFCDGCGGWVGEHTDSQGGARAARRFAKDAGWARRNGCDLCPKCRDRQDVAPTEFRTTEELVEGATMVSLADLSHGVDGPANG